MDFRIKFESDLSKIHILIVKPHKFRWDLFISILHRLSFVCIIEEALKIQRHILLLFTIFCNYIALQRNLANCEVVTLNYKFTSFYHMHTFRYPGLF